MLWLATTVAAQQITAQSGKDKLPSVATTAAADTAKTADTEKAVDTTKAAPATEQEEEEIMMGPVAEPTVEGVTESDEAPVAEPTDEPADKPTAAVNPDCPFLDTEKGKYYLDGNPISDKEAEAFLQLNDPEAWKSHKTGNALWISGWCLMGVGTAITWVGGGIFCYGTLYTAGSILATAFSMGQYQPDSETIGKLLGTGGGLLAAGGIMTAGSIPLIVVGGIKKFSAHEMYNENCAKKHEPELTLSLQTSANGLGLALNF